MKIKIEMTNIFPVKCECKHFILQMILHCRRAGTVLSFLKVAVGSILMPSANLLYYSLSPEGQTTQRSRINNKGTHTHTTTPPPPWVVDSYLSLAMACNASSVTAGAQQVV